MKDNKPTGMSRRTFGKKTAAGATALSTFHIANQALAAKGDMLKIAVIGCGGRGTGAVRNAIAASESAELVAAHDVVEAKAKNLVKKLEEDASCSDFIKVDPENIFGGVDGYKKLLKVPFDYLILATPPGWRPIHFEAAVNAKKHIFTEKPIATDSVGTRRFMKAVEKAESLELCVVAGTQRRHQRPYVETIEKIHDGKIGEVTSGRAYWNGGLPHARPRKPGMSDLEYQCSENWYNFCWICGDNIVEQHVHNLDVMNWVLKSHPIKVEVTGGRAWKPATEVYGNIWDNFACDFEYPNGVHVLSMCRHWNNSPSNVSEAIVGTKGRSNCRDMGENGRDPYVQEHFDLQASIRGDAPYVNEGIQVAESVFTSIFGRMAGYSGQVLEWDKALNADYDILPKNLSFDAKIPVDPIPVPGDWMPY